MSRAAVERELYDTLDRITFTKENSDRYRELFKSMNDVQFKAFFKEVGAGRKKLPIFIPHHSATKMDFGTVIKEAERIGLEYYGQIEAEVDGITVSSMQEVMILRVPLRRLAQTLTAKISLAENDSKIDSLTGQVVSASRAASISSVELSVLSDIGLPKTGTELAVVRGGDSGSYSYLKAATTNTGSASLSAAMEYRTGVGSRKATRMFLLGKHIGTNL